MTRKKAVDPPFTYVPRSTPIRYPYSIVKTLGYGQWFYRCLECKHESVLRRTHEGAQKLGALHNCQKVILGRDGAGYRVRCWFCMVEFKRKDRLSAVRLKELHEKMHNP